MSDSWLDAQPAFHIATGINILNDVDPIDTVSKENVLRIPRVPMLLSKQHIVIPSEAVKIEDVRKNALTLLGNIKDYLTGLDVALIDGEDEFSIVGKKTVKREYATALDNGDTGLGYIDGFYMFEVCIYSQDIKDGIPARYIVEFNRWNGENVLFEFYDLFYKVKVQFG
jgi:hypothetical protein